VAPKDIAAPGRRRVFRDKGTWGDASLLDHWDLSVLSSPSKDAIIDTRGCRYSYSRADEDADRFAGYLQGHGVRPGDRVIVQLPNWAEYLVVVIACYKLGVVPIPVTTTLRHADLSQVIRQSGACALVIPAAFRHADHSEIAEEVRGSLLGPALVVVVADRLPAGARGMTLLSSAIERSAPLPRGQRRPGRGTDLAAVLFTSGSEAAPKGVMLSHDNIIASERSFAHTLRIGHPDRMLMPAPLGHATGFLHGLMLPMMVDATSVLVDQFTGDRTLAMINSQRCTCGMATPTIIRRILEACDEQACALSDSLRFLCCGGAPVPRQLLARSRSHGVRLYSVYGSTESAPHTSTMCLDDDTRVLTTDGRAVPDVEVRVVDPATRRTLPPGVEGEEASRGPNVFLGYLDDPERTASVLDEDGWYYSGDLCVMDQDGYVRITGRIRDIIIRGGENISPLELEQTIRDMPGVRDVAVVGRPEPEMGERACAFIVLAGGAAPLTVADLKAFFVDRGLAKYKIPEYVELVDALPLNASGKVSKNELRRMAAAQTSGSSLVSSRAEASS